MSKKSRKRNKKILGALAAGLGAMALMKRKKAASVASSDDAGLNVTHSALEGPYINKKPIIKKPVDDSWLDTPRGPHGAGGKGDYWRKQKALALTAGNKVPPSMRGGALHAEGYQRRVPGGGRTAPGWTGGYSMRAKGGRIGAKKGGSVTGIAKRGFGRALMKGKK